MKTQMQPQTAAGKLTGLRKSPAGAVAGFMSLFVLLAMLVFGVPAASAQIVHLKEGSFNGSETPSGSLGIVAGVAVDNSGGTSAGDVYVAGDTYGATGFVSKFDANGKYAGVQFTGAQTPQGSFGFVDWVTLAASRGIAVDGSSAANKGDVYIADAEHDVIDRFSEAGMFLCQITGKTPSTTQEQEHECAGATGSKTPQNGFTPGGGLSALGVAVDPVNGDIYVSDPGDTVIDEFNQAGAYIGQIADSHVTSPSSLAFNSRGELYVVNGQFAAGANVVKFDASGTFTAEVDNASPDYVAVDPATNEAFTNRVSESEEHETTEYTTAGSLRSTFAKEANAGSVGVSSATGKIYISPLSLDNGGVVYVYSSALTVPDVETGDASEIKLTSASLHGHVAPDLADGGGEVTKCYFEYGPTTHYGFTAPCAPMTPYGSAQDVTAELTQLGPSTSYHYRLKAEDAEGASGGEDKTFTTPGPPTVDHEAAEALQTSANLRAHIDPWGYDTTCQLQYVADASFQESRWQDAKTVPCQPQDLGSGFGDILVKLTVTGLARHTIYQYRFLATNQAGPFVDPGGTFETYGIKEYSIEMVKSSQGGRESGLWEEWQPGEVEMQAGAHPYELVTTINLSETTLFSERIPLNNNGPPEELEYSGYVLMNTKDIHADLPPGLVGNPTALPRCSRALLHADLCPGGTQVGMIEVWTDGSYRYPSNGDRDHEPPTFHSEAIYNIAPAGQNPAEFGTKIYGSATTTIPFHVRTGEDYGVTADSIDINSAGVLSRVRVRVWGVPADPAHDIDRRCIVSNGEGHTGCPSDVPLEPLIRTPTSCAGPLAVTASADTWQEPGQYVTKTTELPAFTGCDKLHFEPSFEARPTSSVPDSPTGLHVDLHVPQPEGCKQEGARVECELAEADLKNAKVVLPAGLAIDPSSADGLQACTEAQIGYLPQRSAEAGRPQFTPDPAQCPDAAKVGSVEVDSRLVDHPLPGAVYVAAQDANPFKALLALYVAVYDEPTGVVIKLPGQITTDPLTGQLTASFAENPQLPFEDFKLDLFPGSRAALTTPLTCGSYQSATDMTPWSAPEGKDDATPLSSFQIVRAPGGGACASSEALAPNAPAFEAGTASPIAGSYSPFVLHLKREDGSQRFSSLSVTLPPGLTGKIAGLEECPQADIEKAQSRSHEGEGALEQSNPSCPSGSAVGVVHVGAGSGTPEYVAGRAYFAGPYDGAPFSLVIVTPAVAGPFDLGTVVVRAGLFINPSTAQVTVKSDPFPTILDGIPLDIRSVAVEMNHNDFILNPTSCNVMSVTGEEKSTAGSFASLSSRFQAGGCTNLPFAPSFTASTQGQASKANGASLVVKVNPLPGQANIAKVDLQLPKQLPSRLTTLQKACTEAQFNANPAGCPEGSAIGNAVAHTPILNSPLVGPAYLVSHGGAAFPDVEFVLQGEGVKIVLDGGTQIKNGITYSKFETVPDAPITSFETILPEGPHSVLGTSIPASAKYSLCGQNLTMPTTITGQNGAVVTQTTKIAVTGCPTVVKKALTRAQKLEAALKVCRTKDRGKSKAKRRKREACEKAATRKYESVKKAKGGGKKAKRE